MPTLDDTHAGEMAFRFFDLPAELRNMIYQEAATPERECYVRRGRDVVLDGRLSQGCQTPLLLTSRRFKEEYEAEVYRHAEFTINIGFVPQLQELDGCARFPFLRHLRTLVISTQLETEEDFENMACKCSCYSHSLL